MKTRGECPTRWLRAPLASALLVAGTVAVVLWRLVPVFQRSDDVAFLRIASGSFTGTSDSRWGFTNRAVSSVVSFLYEVAPGTEWYVGYLYVVLLLGLWAFLTALLSGATRSATCLALLACVLFFPTAIAQLVWTDVAIWAAFGGMLLAFRAVLAERRGWLVTGLAIAALGSMVRLPAAMMTAALLAPLAFALDWERRRVVVVLAAAIALFAGLHAVGSTAFPSGPADEAWQSFNGVRAKIHDTPLMFAAAPPPAQLDEIGWTANDLKLFQRWFYSDPAVFSAERLDRAVDVMGRRNRPAAMGLVHDSLTALRAVPLELWLASLLALLLVAGSPVTVATAASVLLGAFAVLVAMTFAVTWQYRGDKAYFVPTLCNCIAAIGFFLAAYRGGHRKRNDRAAWRAAAVATVVLALLVRSSLTWHSLSQSGTAAALQWERRDEMLARMVATAKASSATPPVFVVYGSSLYRQLPVFGAHGVVHAAPVVALGWTTFSPLHVEAMKHFGFTSGLNLWDGLVQRSNSHLIVSPPELEQFLAYYREHRRVDVVATRATAYLDVDLDGRFVFDLNTR